MYPKSIPLSGNNAAVVVVVCDAVAAGWKISPKGKRITNISCTGGAGAVVAC